MEQGQSFDEAVKYCQEIGVAETDPSNDIDGWDAAVKVAALTTVLMRHPLRPDQVERGGIRESAKEQILSAKKDGKRYKVVCSAKREGGRLQARVVPELLPLNDPLAQVSGT